MDRVQFVVCLVLGVFFAYISVAVFGYGAAIAIPAEVLLPFAKSFPTLTITTIDLITQGLPLCIIYCILALLIRQLKSINRWGYLALGIPFYLLHSYFFIMQLPTEDIIYLLAILLPKYIALGLCVLYFVNRALVEKIAEKVNQ